MVWAIPCQTGLRLYNIFPPSTVIDLTQRLSVLAPKLLALAIAEFKSLCKGLVAFLVIKLSRFLASLTDFPLKVLATTLTFLGDCL